MSVWNVLLKKNQKTINKKYFFMEYNVGGEEMFRSIKQELIVLLSNFFILEEKNFL